MGSSEPYKWGVRFPCTHIKVAITKQAGKQRPEDSKQLGRSRCWWEDQLVQMLRKIVWWFLQKQNC